MKKTLWILSVLLCLCVILFVFAACGGGNDDTQVLFDLNGGSSPSAVASEAVTELNASDFFFDVTRSGFNFRGWTYNGVTVFDENGNLVNEVALSPVMSFVAKWSDKAKLTIVSDMPEAGEVSPAGEYDYNTEVGVFAHPNQGYEFVGWFYQNALLSRQEEYNYKMWDRDVTLTARFQLASFQLSLTSNDSDLGLVLINPTGTAQDLYEEAKESSILYTKETTIAAYTKTDVRFLGWFDEDGTLVATNAVYTFVMPNHDYALTAKWNRFRVTYDLDGGINAESNPETYAVEDEVTLAAPTRTGYTFAGWSDGGKIAKGSTGDKTFTANWTPIEYAVSYNLNGGTNNASNPATYTVEDAVTLAAPTREYYTFTGWSDGGKIAKGSTGTKTFTANWTSSGLNYKSNGNGTCSVSGIGSFTGTDLLIPPVSSTGDRVTGIGDTAFSYCYGLKSVTIPDSVTSIGEGAFSGCTGLTSITIPDSVTSIGENAFRGCTGLTAVVWNATNCTSAGSISYPIFNGSDLTTVTIGDNVKTIPAYAFCGCTGLNSVTIGNGVTSIGQEAFYNCSGLTSVTIPDSVTSIGEYAFVYCSGLTSVTIGNGVTSIGKGAFYGCSGLTAVTIPDSVTSIGWGAFYYCSGLTSVAIPDSVTSIRNYALGDCTGLTAIHYQGTKAQWNAISKDYYWNDGTGSYTVHCTDGDIAKGK